MSTDQRTGEAQGITAESGQGVESAWFDDGRTAPKPLANNELRACWCYECLNAPEHGLNNPTVRMMILCPACGNKRCPRASDHRFACTDSNDPGQFGSHYGERPWKDPVATFDEAFAGTTWTKNDDLQAHAVERDQGRESALACGGCVALQAQLDAVGEALGESLLAANDGYHYEAVKALRKVAEAARSAMVHWWETPVMAPKSERGAMYALAEALDVLDGKQESPPSSPTATESK